MMVEKRILIIKFGPLKSLIESLGAIRIIRQHYSHASLDLLTSPEVKHFMQINPYFKEIIGRKIPKKFPGQVKLGLCLRQRKYDHVFDFEDQNITHKLRFFLNLPQHAWSGFMCKVSGLHPVDQYAHQLSLSGLGPPRGWPFGCAPEPQALWLKEREGYTPHLQPAYFGLNPPYVFLIPNAGLKDDQRWPASAYGRLAFALEQKGIEIAVVNEGKTDSTTETILKTVRTAKHLKSYMSLEQKAVLGSRAAFIVGEPSSGMTLAVAAGASAVVMTPKGEYYKQYIPRGPETVVHLTADLLENLTSFDVLQAASALKVLKGSLT